MRACGVTASSLPEPAADAIAMLDNGIDSATELLLDAETGRIFGAEVSWAAEA